MMRLGSVYQVCRPAARRGGRLALLLLLLAGCTGPREWVANGFKVGPQYCPPGVQVTEDWIDADDRRVLSDPAELVAWWGTFNDPVLNSLVAEAYLQNLSLREAGARILEARALRAIAAGSLFPQQQGASASYSHNLTSGTGFDRHFSIWNGSFNLVWELDFWGRFRRAVEAADADLDATVYDYGDVVVTLIADVAATYVDIRTLQTRLALVRRNVNNQRGTYKFTKTRFLGGESSEIDTQQAMSSLAQTEAFVPQLEILLRQAENQLCVLLGIPPQDLSERLGEGKIPTAPREVALGIPAAALLRRPDVRRAERQLAAQSARIGIAESDLYPHISVSGIVGVRGSQFDELFRSGASFGSVGPSLGWDILHYGRILGNVRVQDARFQQLLAAYRQTVLLANLEAENGVVQFLKSQERLASQEEAARAAARTNELITLQLKEGVADFNRVFNVQNFKTQQDEATAVAQGAVAQGLINIYRALGGGWPSPFLGAPLESLPSPLVPPAEDIAPPLPEAIDAEQGAIEFPASIQHAVSLDD